MAPRRGTRPGPRTCRGFPIGEPATATPHDFGNRPTPPPRGSAAGTSARIAAEADGVSRDWAALRFADSVGVWLIRAPTRRFNCPTAVNSVTPRWATLRVRR